MKEMSVLPILGAVSGGSPQTGQASTLSMQLRAFSELHRVCPLHATLAAMLAVLQRLKGLSQGAAPLLPSSTERAVSGGPSDDHVSSNEEEYIGGSSPTHTSSSRSGSPAESPGSSSSDVYSLTSPAGSAASSDSAAHNGNGVSLQRRRSRVSTMF